MNNPTMSFDEWNHLNVEPVRPQPVYIPPTMTELLDEYHLAEDAFEDAAIARQHLIGAVSTARTKYNYLEANIPALEDAWAAAVGTPEAGAARIVLSQTKAELVYTREELEVLVGREKLLPNDDAVLWNRVQRAQEAVYRAVTEAEIATLPPSALTILQQGYVATRASGSAGTWGEWLGMVLPAPPIAQETLNAVLTKHGVSFA